MEIIFGADYMDPDVAYLIGAMVARGELMKTEGTLKLIIRYPKGNLIAAGEETEFDTDKEIRLGMDKIRERFLELFDADIKTIDAGESWDLVIRSTRNTIAWRNIMMVLEGNTTFPYFKMPAIFLAQDTPREIKVEFIRGFADVGGNVRPANRDEAGRHRVRLDILNYPTNWEVPVQLCTLLQGHLEVPVRLITWGHPNLGREWREHQLNVYAEDFRDIGFYFDYKQQALNELAQKNLSRFHTRVKPCPGVRKGRQKKPSSQLEGSNRLDSQLIGKHFNAYWQICKALGCERKPAPREQLELVLEE